MSSSRRLLLLAFVAAFLTGCSKEVKLEYPASQRALAEDIESRGGMVIVDDENPEVGVVSVTLQGTNADDALIAQLTAFPELKELTLRAKGITDASVPHLIKLKKLAVLDIVGTKITPTGYEKLQAAFPDAELSGKPEPEPAP